MSLAYAPKGLFGLLTPQANTTVEAEVAAVTPLGYGWITGRLTSARASIEDRLADYIIELDQTLAQFADAPVKAVALACTGSSYIVGAEDEAAIVARASGRIGACVITASMAAVDGLNALKARRIGVVSAYNNFLTESSRAYLLNSGFDIVAQVAATTDDGGAAQRSPAPDALAEGLARLPREGLDAVLLLGTALPSLRAIKASPRHGAAPVLSSMLCLAWRTIAALDGRRPTGEDLLAWTQSETWGGAGRLA